MSKNDRETQEPTAEVPEERISETRHTILIGGEKIRYTATAGSLVLKQEEEGEDKESKGEKAKASIFFIAYTKDAPQGADETSYRRERPIAFSFNGGPGSSSVWLHLGLLGPRRVQAMDENDEPLPPPYQLTDNQQSLLDETDLVFIDPVSTGFSRAAPGEKTTQYHGFKSDIESVGDFIRLYTTRYKRWSSPKFLIGESYGTTRAAGLSGYLQDRHGMYLNGIAFVSTILNFQTARFYPGNDLPYVLFLPTYTATAWYHRKLPEDLQADLLSTLEEVEAFALGEYNLALIRGTALAGDEREQVVEKLARYTGLSQEYIQQTNIRINIHRFVKELLRDQHRTVGRFDSRYTGIDRDAAGEKHEYDPSYAVVQGAYTAMLNDYVRVELEYESDHLYEIISDRVQPWNYDEHQNQYVNVAETLRAAMSKNPFLQVFVANGYYDLATPYFATHFTFNHLDIDAGLQGNISMGHYEAGHMMYIHEPSLVQLKGDLATFIQSATSR